MRKTVPFFRLFADIIASLICTNLITDKFVIFMFLFLNPRKACESKMLLPKSSLIIQELFLFEKDVVIYLRIILINNKPVKGVRLFNEFLI